MLSSGWGSTQLLECLPSILGVLYWTPAPHKTWHGGRYLSSWHSGSRSRNIKSSNSSSATRGFQDQPGYWRPCLKTQRYPPPKKILREASLSLSFLAPNHPSSLPAVLCPSAGKASSLLHGLEQPP